MTLVVETHARFAGIGNNIPLNAIKAQTAAACSRGFSGL
jgi:hypothetical protein